MANVAEGAVIWDVDGTLVDTAELHLQAWMTLCEEKHLPFTRTDFNATFGQRNPEIIRLLFEGHFTDTEVAELGDRKEMLYRQAARRGIELLPGARRLLEGLHAAGVRQAIGSSAPLANVELILELTNTRPFFAAISSSEDTQRGKPDPQVFLVAAAKLGVAPRNCLVIEDAVAGVQAAKAGGMKCVGVVSTGHYGEDALRQAGADLVAKSLKAIHVDALRALLVPSQQAACARPSGK